MDQRILNMTAGQVIEYSRLVSRRDRGRVHHRMSFRKRRQLRYVEELLRIMEATLGICAVMMMGTGSLWIGMIIMTAGLELSCRYIEKSVKN